MSFRILDLLQSQAERSPTAEAILAPLRTPLTYGGLLALVESAAGEMNARGIRTADRVAIVLPNGPEMATSFVAVSAACTCAPLNPSYRFEEFDFYLSDLGAKAVIVPDGHDSPVRQVAAARDIAVIELAPELDRPAGVFRLGGRPRSGSPAFASADDVALVLHTSGTTSRPKIVPLTQRNLVTSAASISNTLRLAPSDRCLNVMPLFHIHGLIGVVLSSLTAGAAVVCAPGFQAPRFFGWLDEFQPTWYSAVPSMHQAILERAAQNQDIVARSSLRFVRSSSSALPPQVMAKLEEVFRAPVIEAYGMTEASHQMASNPLPPAARKPGSVGLPAGPEIAIMDEQGNLLPSGATGEVVIRGANVTNGYENNPKANEGAFSNGWFRTGDQGYVDADGYLFLTGRLKELINRGGEKISPREIDEVLLDHPLVAQAVAFAIPDERLGEDVGAAVVLKPEAEITEIELREFAAERLADFKVPRRLVILNEIPKGPTGKLQRIGLAEKLGLTKAAPAAPSPSRSFRSPATEQEALICGMWQEILGIPQVGADDDFFRLGGDSILAVQFIQRLGETAGVELTMVRLFEAPTAAAIARLIPVKQPAETAALG
ncbi:MAG: AMP-binding protein [Bryobacteraceae bacterium]|nr:AMP-binding protein [Bryobacteraceae bacterium]